MALFFFFYNIRVEGPFGAVRHQEAGFGLPFRYYCYYLYIFAHDSFGLGV